VSPRDAVDGSLETHTELASIVYVGRTLAEVVGVIERLGDPLAPILVQVPEQLRITAFIGSDVEDVRLPRRVGHEIKARDRFFRDDLQMLILAGIAIGVAVVIRLVNVEYLRAVV
jgi:hypothetical protein